MSGEQVRLYGMVSFVFSLVWIIFLGLLYFGIDIPLIFDFLGTDGLLFIILVFPIWSVIFGILQKRKGQTNSGEAGLIGGILEVIFVIFYLSYYFYMINTAFAQEMLLTIL